MKNRKKKRPSALILRLRASGGGMASATRGRARTFTDRKKAASRRACRGKVEA
tara:strand:- start:235 stop:393 length:159 start_codon:yes stop_codon:yes gene_type:complete